MSSKSKAGQEMSLEEERLGRAEQCQWHLESGVWENAARLVGLGKYKRFREELKRDFKERIKFSRVRKPRFVRREVWRSLVGSVEQGKVGYEAAVACLLLAYFWKAQRGHKTKGIIVIKKYLNGWGTTIETFGKAVAELKQAMPELFTVKEDSRAFEITNWTGNVN